MKSVVSGMVCVMMPWPFSPSACKAFCWFHRRRLSLTQSEGQTGPPCRRAGKRPRVHGVARPAGAPLHRYTDDEINTVYYGLGLHLGVPVRQNPRGDLLGVVMSVGDPTQKTTRVYETNLYLPYHSDPSDVVGLLCVRKAKAGGVSSLNGFPAPLTA